MCGDRSDDPYFCPAAASLSSLRKSQGLHLSVASFLKWGGNSLSPWRQVAGPGGAFQF